MKPIKFNSPLDVLALMVRRKWWIIAPFFLLSTAIALITYILPYMYVSETLILIRPRDVPEDFVKDLIAGTTEQRLSAIEQTVLSRTNLLQILREFEDQLSEYNKLNMDERVLRLRNQIKVQFEADKRAGGSQVTYFRISYQNRNPALAQKIAAKLTSLFIEQDNRARESQVFGTTEFLGGALDGVTEQLKQSETKLKEIRARRRFELPEQLETNLRRLEQLGVSKQANIEAVDRENTLKFDLEKLMSETPPTVSTFLGPASGRPAGKSAYTASVEEYRKKKEQLDELLSKGYGDEWPDVKGARLQAQRLKDKLSPEELASLEHAAKGEGPDGEPLAMTKTAPNPQYQTLQTRLREVNTELEIRERERKAIAAEIDRYLQRVQNTPQSEQEIGEIVRQNADLNKQYQKMKSDLDQATLSASLESRQKGSQFVILDPANFPLTPAKPAKGAIALGGSVGSLVFGLVLAAAVDLLHQKIWTQFELENLLGGAVLAEIPEILTEADRRLARKRRLKVAVSFAVLAVVHISLLYFILMKQGFILRSLDPYLQKIYS